MWAKLELVFEHCQVLKNASQLRMCKNPTTLLYSDTTKREMFFDEKKTVKNIKITKRSQAFKGYAGSYDFEVLNSFNPELQLKESGKNLQLKIY